MRKKRRLKWQVYLIIFVISIFLLPVTFSKFTTTFNNNINLSITKPTYTVKFDGNGGTGDMSDISCKYGFAQTLPSNTFVNGDKIFLGWNTEQNGSGEYYRDNEEIMYLSSTNGGEITLYAQWLDNSYLDNTTKLKDYNCTESVEKFTAPSDGYYLLEAWGAQGGSVPVNINGSKILEAIEGGKGGYSYGIVYLNKDDEIYVVAGCEGKTLINSVKGVTLAGGYNGGGIAYSNNEHNYQGSGGGATHFAINQNLGVLENYVDDQNDVLLVAGGGGGSYSSSDIYYYSTGGSGGGLLGGIAVVYYKTGSGYRTSLIVNNNYEYYQGLEIPGGGQTQQINTSMYIFGTFGKGTDAEVGITGSDAGAGGGWYGGAKLNYKYGGGGMAGSGGSGHINTTKLITGQTLAGNIIIPTHDGNDMMIGNTGDGYAKISYIKPHYTVKFNANGGTGTMSDMDYAYDETKKLISSTFTRNGCTFKKWNTESDGSGTDYTDEQSISKLSSTYDDIINLYAQWECNIYFQLPPDWDGSNVYIHLFNSSSNNGWPGYSATLSEATKNIYNYKLSQSDISNYDNVIFSNANSSTRQSIDLSLNSTNFGQIFVPELYSGSGTRVFFSGSSDWVPYIYLWNNSTGDNNHAWAGELMSSKISGSGYCEVVDTSLYDRMIFNNGSGGVGNQTDNLNIPAHQDLTYKLARNGGNTSHTVSRFYYDGSWHDYTTWIDSGYDTWHATHYASFVAAQSALKY